VTDAWVLFGELLALYGPPLPQVGCHKLSLSPKRETKITLGKRDKSCKGNFSSLSVSGAHYRATSEAARLYERRD
jgi:hypothetical protein